MPHCIATSAMEREGEFRINSLALATRSEVMYEVVLRPVNALILRLSCGRVMKNCEVYRQIATSQLSEEELAG